MDEAPKRNILLPMDSKDEQTTPEGTKSATREGWFLLNIITTIFPFIWQLIYQQSQI